MSTNLMRKVGEQSTRPNPWPLYAQLRSQRVFPLGEHSYVIGHYDDVVALLHDPRVSSNPHNLTDPGEAAITITHPLPFTGSYPLLRPADQPGSDFGPGAVDPQPDRHADRQIPPHRRGG